MIKLCSAGSFEQAMIETPEERAYFATVLAGQSEWRAERALRIAACREKLMQNIAAQSFAPEGRYAYEFDGNGVARLTTYAIEIYDDEDRYLRKIRIQAATRRL